MDMTLHKIMDLLWTLNIKEQEFCRAIGINKSAVTDWKTGKTKSYKRHLPKIAAYLQTTTSYLTERCVLLSEPDEIELVEAYSSMSQQGKELVLQMVDGVKDKYKKCDCVSDMEIAE